MKTLFRKLHGAFQLSFTDWRLFIWAWMLLLLFDMGLRVCSFQDLQAYASRLGSRIPPRQTDGLLNSLKLAVDRASSHHLVPMTCLRRALTLQKMLAHMGIAVELKIGVQRETGQFGAHAWLEYRGRPLGEPESITESFGILRTKNNK